MPDEIALVSKSLVAFSAFVRLFSGRARQVIRRVVQVLVSFEKLLLSEWLVALVALERLFAWKKANLGKELWHTQAQTDRGRQRDRDPLLSFVIPITLAMPRPGYPLSNIQSWPPHYLCAWGDAFWDVFLWDRRRDSGRTWSIFRHRASSCGVCMCNDLGRICHNVYIAKADPKCAISAKTINGFENIVAVSRFLSCHGTDAW